MTRIQNKHRGVRAAGAILLSVLSCMMVSAAAWAGSSERVGTNAAPELLIAVGPRSDALGGNTVADVNGAEAIFWNPAGMATLKGTQVMFTHLRHIGDNDVNFLGFATKAGDFGTVGFSAKVLSVGDILVTTEQAPDGTGETLSPTFATVGVSYARQFTDRVTFGATAQFINERIQDAQAKGVAFDFGFQYDTGPSGLTFGFVMKNFGPSLSYSGPAFEINVPDPNAEPGADNRTLAFSSAQSELPSYFQIGAAYKLWNQGDNHFKVLGTFTSNNFTPDDYRVGGELMLKDRLALRGGYNRFVSDTNLEVYQGPSFGAGIKFPLGGSNMQFDYAQRVVKDFFSDTHEFGLRVDF
jgi:hypothetical protein